MLKKLANISEFLWTFLLGKYNILFLVLIHLRIIIPPPVDDIASNMGGQQKYDFYDYIPKSD